MGRAWLDDRVTNLFVAVNFALLQMFINIIFLMVIVFRLTAAQRKFASFRMGRERRDYRVCVCAHCEIPAKWENEENEYLAHEYRVNPFRLKCFQSLCRGPFEILIFRWHRWWWRRRRRPCEWWTVEIFRHQIQSTFELSQVLIDLVRLWFTHWRNVQFRQFHSSIFQQLFIACDNLLSFNSRRAIKIRRYTLNFRRQFKL